MNHRQVRPLLCAAIVIHVFFLVWTSYRQSPTLNEPAHLAAGLCNWTFGRFEPYRVNPPLVRLIASIPVMAVEHKTNWYGFIESPGARPEFTMGEDFVRENGYQTFWLMTLARWACIPFSILGLLLCYFWGKSLWGRPAGLVAVVLWTFSPDMIAHGSLITTDRAAAVFGAGAAYSFSRYLSAPGFGTATVAGVLLGCAILSKFTWLILFGFWPLVAIVAFVKTPGALGQGNAWWKVSLQLLVLNVVALNCVHLCYGFEGTKKLGDFDFVSRALKGNAEGHGNRFRGHFSGEFPVPFPYSYIQGIDVQKDDFEDFGHPSYLAGRWSMSGWWYYYLYGFAAKTPIALLIMFPLAAFRLLFRQQLSFNVLSTIVLPPLFLGLLVSCNSSINHHYRYALPVLPFLFVACGILTYRSTKLQQKGLGVLLIIYVISSFSSLPHSIAYFNEVAGGTDNGHSHMAHSSLDWGQDLLNLDHWIRARTGKTPVFGCFCIKVRKLSQE